jgi:lantibiotic leader peptide-processing serine protease
MRRIVPLLCIAALAACSDNVSVPASVAGPRLSVSNGGPRSYIIDFIDESVPATLAAEIQAAGGTLTASLDRIGVAVASSSDPSFPARATAIPGVNGVDPDPVMQLVDPIVAPTEATVDPAEGTVEGAVSEQSHEVGGHETFRAVQWAPDAIQAPAAWAIGARGRGARVAILDGGIHSTHVDIAPNLDITRSTSFAFDTNGVLTPFNSDGGTFWHGTHVAGIVGAPADNTALLPPNVVIPNVGTVGIAPEATLIGVKVLHNGSGAFSWMLAGIYYAATPIAEGGAGANIINMSLGAGIPKGGPGWAHLQNALKKATKYANSRGVTVIAATGNSAIDLDAEKKLLFYPAQSKDNLGISATGPLGWALAPTTANLDRFASYSNFGEAIVDLAAPGGDAALPGNAVCSRPRNPTGTVVNFCWVFDMVMAPCRGAGTSTTSYCWASGTSMASPAAAGVAALIVGKNPGISPLEVEAKLRASADDRGAPGFDAQYGSGRVNALRAVQ